MAETNKPITHLALFQEKSVRRVWYGGRWYFSIIDVIAILADTDNPRRYWTDFKRKLVSEGYDQVYAKIVQLKMQIPETVVGMYRQRPTQFSISQERRSVSGVS
jgi:hypothetical protein